MGFRMWVSRFRAWVLRFGFYVGISQKGESRDLRDILGLSWDHGGIKDYIGIHFDEYAKASE